MTRPKVGSNNYASNNGSIEDLKITCRNMQQDFPFKWSFSRKNFPPKMTKISNHELKTISEK